MLDRAHDSETSSPYAAISPKTPYDSAGITGLRLRNFEKEACSLATSAT